MLQQPPYTYPPTEFWLDQFSRTMIRSGELRNWIQKGFSGVTTNPSIFSQAIAQDSNYQEQIKSLKAKSISAKTRYETLIITDVQAACDLFYPLYQRSKYHTGYISVEIDPRLANHYQESLAETLRLYQLIERSNVLIKIPATQTGIALCPELITRGVSLNMTLIFSSKQANAIQQAYYQGLKQRLANKNKLHNIHLVASFFLSRLDNAVDQKIPSHLQGKTALAIAEHTYEDWQNFTLKHAALTSTLHDAGATKPRLLWASTSVKNPHYPQLMYVDHVTKENTILTLPVETANTWLENQSQTNYVEKNVQFNATQADDCLNEIEALGIDLQELATELQKNGIEQFTTAFNHILEQLT